MASLESRPRKKLMAKAINGHFWGAIMDCSDLPMYHYGWPGSFTLPYGWIENEKIAINCSIYFTQ
jgi:hypothetical protein